MSKRMTGGGQHRDRYAGRPREPEVRDRPAERTDSGTRYRCTTCSYIGDLAEMDRHRDQRGHWMRVATDEKGKPPAKVKWVCSCGHAGSYTEVQIHAKNSPPGEFHTFKRRRRAD